MRTVDKRNVVRNILLKHMGGTTDEITDIANEIVVKLEEFEK